MLSLAFCVAVYVLGAPAIHTGFFSTTSVRVASHTWQWQMKILVRVLCVLEQYPAHTCLVNQCTVHSRLPVRGLAVLHLSYACPPFATPPLFTCKGPFSKSVQSLSHSQEECCVEPIPFFTFLVLVPLFRLSLSLSLSLGLSLCRPPHPFFFPACHPKRFQVSGPQGTFRCCEAPLALVTHLWDSSLLLTLATDSCLIASACSFDVSSAVIYVGVLFFCIGREGDCILVEQRVWASPAAPNGKQPWQPWQPAEQKPPYRALWPFVADHF